MQKKYVIYKTNLLNIPIISSTIKNIFGDENENKIKDIGRDKVTAVVNGATVRAHQIQTNTLSTEQLKDVLPHSISFGLNDRNLHLCLKKDSQLPCQFVQRNIGLNRDYQKRLVLEFFQGEGKSINDTRKVRSIGKIIVDIPRFTKQNEIEMELKLEVNEKNEIKVSIYNQRTGKLMNEGNTQIEFFDMKQFTEKLKQHMQPYEG